MTPIEATCDRTYKAKHFSGWRPVSQIRWVVLHDGETSSAEGMARYFAYPPNAAVGSAHLCVDEKSCYRTLSNQQIPWAAPGANAEGFHIEQAGFARWSTVIWKAHRLTLRRAAYKTALHCKLFGIPPYFVKAEGLRAGRKGVTTHAECTKAFGPVGGHTDPGPMWPRFFFMRLVRSFYAELSL